MLENFAIYIVHGGLFLIFLILLLETNPFGGIFIPGQTIVFLLAFLISIQGGEGIYLALIVVFLASFLGDLLGYYLGKKYGSNFLKLFRINKNNKLYKYSEKFFKEYGGLAVILGRQTNVNRGFVPFLAGYYNMNLWYYTIIIFFSGILWTSLSMGIGYYLGDFILREGESFMILLGLLTLYFILVYFLYKIFSDYYLKNFYLFRKYALDNLIYLVFLLVVIGIVYSLGKFVGVNRFNELFSFVMFDSFLWLNDVLINIFVIVSMFVLFLALLFFYDKNKMLESCLGAIFVMYLLVFISGELFEQFFNIELYYLLIFFILGLFFIYVTLKELYLFEENNYIRKLKYSLFVVISFLAFLSEMMRELDFFTVLISYLVAVFFTEVLVLFSHYKILLNEELSGGLYKSKRIKKKKKKKI